MSEFPVCQVCELPTGVGSLHEIKDKDGRVIEIICTECEKKRAEAEKKD